MTQPSLLDAAADLRRSVYSKPETSQKFIAQAIRIIEQKKVKDVRIKTIKRLLKQNPNPEEILMAAVLLQNEITSVLRDS